MAYSALPWAATEQVRSGAPIGTRCHPAERETMQRRPMIAQGGPMRIAVSTTLVAGVATAVAASANHHVVLHVLDGAEPTLAAFELSERSAAPENGAPERTRPAV